MNRRRLSHLGMLVVVIFCGIGLIKIMQMPHSLTTGQILQRFSWQMKVAGHPQGSVRFSSETLKITASHAVKSYHYSINDDDVLTIKNGRFAGKYDLQMDTIDYNLVPEKADGQKIRLVRND